MFKVVQRIDHARTRSIIMKNLETGTKEDCFDDSELLGPSYKDFGFVKAGGEYDCKILLFGSTSPGLGQKASCRISRDCVLCGDTEFVEVFVGKDKYYVLRDEVEEQLKNGEFDYYYTRKDLIQVNNVIHFAYLD